MCSYFSKRMENYQGDLTDIIRASRCATGGGVVAEEDASSAALPEWQFPSNPVSYSADPAEGFGDPFAQLRDPLLHDIDTPVSGFFHGIEEAGNIGGFAAAGGDNINGSSFAGQKLLEDEMKRPSNIFSRMLQISPSTKMPPVSPCHSPAVAAAAPPRSLKGAPMLVPNDHALISPNSSKGRLVESPGLQISSPRIAGIKRRKSQAKKVVCIPAPAPANSRPSSGEVVPSDLWAWRKYGQKPIKGSPYPRGYYRCSSSKGCSARKQVERSRTDPNMLVITYTSEHNHTWPTQRNALAGSTRSQPSKTNAAAAKNHSSNSQQAQKCKNPKDEQKDNITTENAVLPSPAADGTSAPVKGERGRDFESRNPEFDEGFPPSYKPALPPSSRQSDDTSFFAELGEIEANSFDMFLAQGFPGDDDGRDGKSLDPFSFYDWTGNNNGSTSAGAGGASYGEAKRNP